MFRRRRWEFSRWTKPASETAGTKSKKLRLENVIVLKGKYQTPQKHTRRNAGSQQNHVQSLRPARQHPRQEGGWSDPAGPQCTLPPVAGATSDTRRLRWRRIDALHAALNRKLPAAGRRRNQPSALNCVKKRKDLIHLFVPLQNKRTNPAVRVRLQHTHTHILTGVDADARDKRNPSDRCWQLGRIRKAQHWSI